jgi:DnaJ-class molecular chaperone
MTDDPRDDEYEEWDEEAPCTHCLGEGVREGDRPGWDNPGELVNCRSCNGTGLRREQVVF